MLLVTERTGNAGVTVAGGYRFGSLDGAGINIYNSAELWIDDCIVSTNYL